MLILPSLCDAQVINLTGFWKFSIGDQRNWSEKDYNDLDWETIKVPSAWEKRGFHGYDGFAWYRISFDGKKLSKNDKMYLNLGYIDDADEVYLNGELIGFSGSMPPHYKTAYNSERQYVLPSAVIDFEGKNIIAIRVYDATQMGGIIEGNPGIYTVATGSPMLIDLQGVWDFAKSKNGAKPNNEYDWDRIIAPGFWEKQGYWKYDGFAWYRRSFDATDDMLENELILILGKIDDFDEVYINGKLAGYTGDQRRLGASESYSKFRAYKIPSVLLNTGKNTIEILVEDIGLDGGIYEGPIGITTRELFDRHFRR